ncbi:MAG: FKBP-type peptidyl-prolyl cis-trans isomerase [Muribaculaceae bacterium]|nr:FKBP-type peptidyl-prolyl cis-trans isomerase [Muribaculaceae bacterium]
MTKKEYTRLNTEWLEAKSSEPDVHRAASGVFYKILASGDSSKPSPRPNSVVTVHYTGRTIDNHVFDSSRDDAVPPAFRLRDLITGWIEALQLMHPGDRWELYIAADKAYGKQSQPDIPGGSTLIFDIELISVA